MIEEELKLREFNLAYYLVIQTLEEIDIDNINIKKGFHYHYGYHLKMIKKKKH